MTFQTKMPHEHVDAIAPDGSEIRVLLALSAGSTAHGTLPPGAVSAAVQHRTVEEIWYVLAGEAEIWRRCGDLESIEQIGPGVSLTIPLGTAFQFRTTSDVPFQFLMMTMPPWPGEDEAIPVPGAW